jgi:CDP-glucose 4,6-dehydratase
MPQAVRPWQHVLDALHGYLMLAERLATADGGHFATGWNFGPDAADEISVGELAQRTAQLWGDDARLQVAGNFQKETAYLRLDSAQARARLGWRPRWPLAQGLARSVEWYRAWSGGTDLRALSLAQLDAFMNTA